MSTQYEATFQQKYWFELNSSDKKCSAYNIPLVFTIEGGLEIEIFKQAVIDLVNKNDIFNTAFTVDNNQLYAYASLNDTVGQFHVLEIAENVTVNFSNKIGSFIQQPFDLETGPLYRSLLIKNKNLNIIFVFVVTDPYRGWKEFSQNEIDLLDFDCNHYNMLEHVEVAKSMSSTLDSLEASRAETIVRFSFD